MLLSPARLALAQILAGIRKRRRAGSARSASRGWVDDGLSKEDDRADQGGLHGTDDGGLPSLAELPFSNEMLCVEYTWRKGEFLDSGNRSAVASYIRTKLKHYAIGLGWVQA